MARRAAGPQAYLHEPVVHAPKASAPAQTPYKNFTSANLRISHDPYNDAAAQFNELRGGFPAGLIGGVCGVDGLEAFN